MINKMKDIDYSNAKITNYYSKDLSIKEKLMLIWDILSSNEEAIYMREVTKIEEKEVEAEKLFKNGDRVVFSTDESLEEKSMGSVKGEAFTTIRRYTSWGVMPAFEKKTFVIVVQDETNKEFVCDLNFVYKYLGADEEIPAATVV